MAAVAVDEARLRQICARYGIATLRIFGSVARGDDTSSSDIDVLYELQPGTKLGWEIEDLNRELNPPYHSYRTAGASHQSPPLGARRADLGPSPLPHQT